MNIIKLCGIGIIGGILALTVKGGNPTGGKMVSTLSLAVILSLVIARYAPLIKSITELSEKSDISLSRYTKLMIKALGIGLTVKTASDLCRDMGENGIAESIELAGKLEILLLCLPLAYELINISIGIMP